MKKVFASIFLVSMISQNILAEQKAKLSDFAYNKYSEYGEDGIVQQIFEIIGVDSKVCLEVGAGEGPSGSNIAHLWRNLGWQAILIEGDPIRLEKLEPSLKGFSNCTLVKAYIEKNTRLGSTIDSIVQDLGVDTLDLLSLDVDGNDYHIFESLQIRPRVIIIEFNHTIPYYRDVYQQYADQSWDIGCSVAALQRMGKQKGYELVAVTNVNALFVERIYFDQFSAFETSIEKLFHTQYLKNIILSFSGDPIVIGKKNYLSDGFFKVGYPRKLHCNDCYVLRINEIDLHDDDLHENFPGFPKTKPH